jgi:hypothetical protein
MSYSTLATHNVTLTGAYPGYLTKTLVVVAFPPATLFITPRNQPSAFPGSNLYSQVRLVGFPVFNSWDIGVSTNPAVLLPNGVLLEGTMLGGAAIVGECINGFGDDCGVSDGLGVVHVAVTSVNGSYASGDGLLFTIDYVAVTGPDFTLSASPTAIGPIPTGESWSSTITIRNLFGTAVTIFNDDITDPSGNSIPHTTVNGTYGAHNTVRLSLSTGPGLTASITPSVITGSGNATLTATASSPGTYALVVNGTSPGFPNQVSRVANVTVTVVGSLNVVHIQSIFWTRTLRLSETDGQQTWVVRVHNTGKTTEYVQISINSTTNTGTNPFNAQSGVATVAPGVTVKITVQTTAGTFTSSEMDLNFKFQISTWFGSSPTSLPNLAYPTRNGDFNVAP